MTAAEVLRMEGRVLLVMPSLKDAERSLGLLSKAGLFCIICKDVEDLCKKIAEGAGAALLTEEAATRDQDGSLAAVFAKQAAWSDFPLVVLVREGRAERRNAELLEGANVTLVERPVRFRTLLSVVQSALRARRRQYEIRNYLAERERQAEELRESREWLSTTLNSIADAVIATDRRQRIVFMNPVAERVTGWSLAQALGESLADVFQVVDPQTNRRLAPATTAMEENHVVGIPRASVMMTRTGRETPIEDSVAPLKNQHEGVVGAVVVFRDVTEKRRTEDALKRSERVYRAIGESLDYGVWVSEPKGRNKYASESFLKLLGLTQEQFSASGWKTALHPDDLAGTVAAWRECVHTGGFWDQEHRFRGADGRWHPILARGVPVRDEKGEIVSWVGIHLDIARLKAAEEELKAANRGKDDFLAMLAHELRNPLTPITNAVHILKSSGDDPITVESVRQMIERQVGHMSRIVNDLLDVSRVSRGKVSLQLERLDLAKLLRLNAEDNRKSIEEAGLRLALEIPGSPIWILGDPTRLSQILDNLLHNALKFTAPGGVVSISLATAEDRMKAMLVVCDTGIGIEAELIGRLFDAFAQGDRSLDRTRGGLGLGLALARGLVEMHGGTIAAASGGVDCGSEFTITVPIHSEPPALTAPSTPNAAPCAKRKVLVVEDNQDAADSLKMLLEAFGYAVTVAYTGPDGVDAAFRGLPDVVLCDIGLPGMDGFAVARALRAEKSTANARLIAVTGYGRDEDHKRALDSGFDNHLTKPADPQQIMKLVASPFPKHE